MGPGYLPITKGAYAGPVTEGNTDVMVLRLPSARKAFSEGTRPARIAESSVSGRAPSATIMIIKSVRPELDEKKENYRSA